MASRLTISAEWERLDEGAAEERACFAAIGIWRNDISLTAGHDSFVKRRSQDAVLVRLSPRGVDHLELVAASMGATHHSL